jgi:soluble lytic murein transglycosylase
MPTLPNPEDITRQPPQISGTIASYQPGITQNASAELSSNVARQGQILQQEADQEADRLDALKAEDAYNKLRASRLNLTMGENGYTKIQGGNVLNNKITENYPKLLEQQILEIDGTLLNQRQKDKFKQLADREMLSFKGDVFGHSIRESEKFQDQVTKGTIAVEIENAKSSWNDNTQVERSRERIINSLSAKYQREGIAADAIEIELKKDLSALHVGVLEQALNSGDLAYAAKYLDKNKKEILTDSLIKANKIIKLESDTKIGLSVAENVFKKSFSKIVPNDFDRAFGILLNTESGGKQFGKDGKPLTSSAGAIGVAQVMPKTGPEAARLAGLKWDDDKYRNDTEYNKQLGMAYFKQQITDFGGDLSKAYAAYNAGPGATQKAIKEAIKAGSTDNWLSYLPAETQNYVAKNTKEYGNGGGVGKRPTLEDIHNEIRETVGNNPTMLKVAIDESTKRFEETQKAIKQKEDETVSEAMQHLFNNGGKLSALPPTLKASIPPKDLDNLMTFADKVSKGKDETDFAWYQKLTDNNYLKGLSDNQFYNVANMYLSKSDAKHFANERAKLIGKPIDNKIEDINTASIKTVLSSRLAQLGLDPSPKDGSDDAVRMGAINEFVRKSIANEQAEQGKKLSDVDIEKHIDRLFQNTVNIKTSLFGIQLKQNSQRLMEMSAGDIPKEQRKMIEDNFKKHGIDNPNDGDILGAYLQMKGGKRGSSGAW